MTHPIPGADSAEQLQLDFEAWALENDVDARRYGGALGRGYWDQGHKFWLAYKGGRAAAKVGANVAADIPTWHSRVRQYEGPNGYVEPEQEAMKAEIADLRKFIAAGAPAETPKESFHEKLAREIRDGTAVFEKRASGAQAETPKPEPKDWPEDFAHENGNYQNRCSACGGLFMGHKRRVTCKECAAQPLPAPIAGDVEKDAADAARYRWLRHGDNDELVLQRGPVDPDYVYLPRNFKLDEMIDAHINQAAAMLANSSSGEAG